MSRTATTEPGAMDAIKDVMIEAFKSAIQSVQPKSIQTMSAAAFAKVDLPRPPIPTFQNGLPVDLRGIEPATLEKTMRQLGELPSGSYLDGIFKVKRTEPTFNTEGRLDIRYDSSTTEKRMAYAWVGGFPNMIDLMWREAEKAGRLVKAAA